MRTWTWRSAILCAGFLLVLLTPQTYASPASARAPVRSSGMSCHPLDRTTSAPSVTLTAGHTRREIVPGEAVRNVHRRIC
jgi:hypothetical protein